MNTRALHERKPGLGNTSDATGKEVLRLARSSIEYGLIYEEPLPVDCDELPRVLTDPAATFTTLHVEGQLRGCCGTLEAVRPLAADVTHSAFRAAFRDPRFNPVGKHELQSIRLEVSAKGMNSAGETDPSSGSSQRSSASAPRTSRVLMSTFCW